jgi:2-polyprenyl-3-methyl-5-hydroxy-6-metoxy-1,4-benzoquinol methylase
MGSNDYEPGRDELEAVARLKHGNPEKAGWGVRMRHRFGYFTPDVVYKALVSRLVGPQSRWADLGCGRDIFPDHRPLARVLADRCAMLVGVDPGDRLDENPFVHRKVKSTIEDFQTDDCFDLVTLRMVVEHVARPEAVLATLDRITRPGGKVVVYTVNRWAPVSIISALVPFGLHHAIKYWLWRTEEKETFPVVYAMNTRKRLRILFEAHGFCEAYFQYLDDCRSLARFQLTHFTELALWRLLRTIGLQYPETCLLGVYERL